MVDEKVFLQEGNIFVSNSRIVINATTYSTANITSVRKGMTPAKQGCAFLSLVFGAFILLGGLIAILSELIANGIILLLVGGLIVVGAVFWMKSLKPVFHVILSTAGGETQALSSKNAILINKAIDAINDAIIHRG